MRCDTPIRTAYWIRVFFYQAHHVPLKAAPQGAHRHVLRQGQHSILDTRALFYGAPRASLSRPTRGAPAYDAASARRTGHACSSIRRTARPLKPPHRGRTGMYCGTRSTAYWIRVLFSMAHRAPLKAAPQGAHRLVLRHAQHGILDTRALLYGAPRASLSRPTRGAPAYDAA